MPLSFRIIVSFLIDLSPIKTGLDSKSHDKYVVLVGTLQNFESESVVVFRGGVCLSWG